MILDIITSSGTTWRLNREAKTWVRILENGVVMASGKLAGWPNKITVGKPVSIIRECTIKTGQVDVFTTSDVVKINNVNRDEPNVRESGS